MNLVSPADIKMAALHRVQMNGDDGIEDGARGGSAARENSNVHLHRRAITERTHLLDKEDGDSMQPLSRKNSRFAAFFIGVDVLCAMVLVAYFSLAWAIAPNDSDPNVCIHGGRSFSAPLSYVVIACASVAGIMANAAMLIALFSKCYMHALMFLPSAVGITIVAVEQGMMLSNPMDLFNSCIAVLVLCCTGLALHLLNIILSIHMRFVIDAAYTLSVPPAGD